MSQDRAGIVVRAATAADEASVVDGINALLAELGGRTLDAASAGAAFRALLDRPATGWVLVACPAVPSRSSEVVGLLTVSVQHAIRTRGPYALIQELWVSEGGRGLGVGRALFEACVQQCAEQDISVVEVGLPSERFPEFASTQAYYRARGFVDTGPRMRWTAPKLAGS
ncbi:MAG: GNAT family N-acetyltransferase [Chloroflexi bacterium]|nr:GNAT family N-acetyltransferase [Chloroflexota bacterium]